MKEFAIHLEPDQKKPLYEQIYEAVRDGILDGHIPEGEKLPSTRFEAAFLSCSRSTVELAYDQLLSEGYIRSEPYRGYFACDVRELYHLADCVQHDISAPIQQNKLPEYRVDFSPNGTELSQFPFAVMGKIMKNLMLDEGEHMMQSSDPFGEPDLRQSICDYLFRSRNVSCRPEQIIIGAGNEYLLIVLCQMLGADHTVAMESPTYLQAYRSFRNIGYEVQPIDMDRNGMRVDMLQDSMADIVYVMPSHQFPMGTVMPMKRRLELLRWAGQKDDRYIIEDDYDSEFRYKGKPIPALQGLDRAGRVVYLGTFSRSIAPATRVSYLVLPQHLLEKYRAHCGFYACTVPVIMQKSIYHFMREGYFEKNLNRMRGVYKAKHDFLLNELRKCCWISKIFGENSGLHLLSEIKTDLPEEKLVLRCQEADVRVYGLSEYFLSRPSGFGKPVLLFGYGGLTEDEMREGLACIADIV